MVTIVLLKVLLMWAAPCGTFFFSRRRVVLPLAAPFLAADIYLPGLLLAGDRALGSLAGALVGLGPLAAHRQATTVSQTLVAADLDLAADVGLHFAAQIAFHLEVLFDVIAQLGDLIVGQVLGAHVLVDAGGRKDLPGAGTADAVDVGQRDLHALVAREIHAH